MTKKELKCFFTDFLKKESFFINKSALQSNYFPKEIPHRTDQINQIANILAPCLRMEKPSNLFIYGKTGTGKTLSIKHTTDTIKEIAIKENIPVEFVYINCKLKKIADTEYRIIAELARGLGKPIPSTGLPTDEVYNIFYSAIDAEKKIFILVMDEIDQLLKKAGDDVLYNLIRINTELKNSQISIIGISNDLLFTDNLDPRIKSSLSEEELIFPTYNALQIKDIISARIKEGLKKESLSQGVIEKCAAYAAREHGDARRALELIRVAVEIAERDLSKKVDITHLDKAEEKIEKDRIMDIILTQPKQFQTVLYSIILINQKKRSKLFTGEIYEVYKGLCEKTNLNPLTQRRLSDILAEFDMMGIINANVISKGRYGRTREINLAISRTIEPKVIEILKSDLNL